MENSVDYAAIIVSTTQVIFTLTLAGFGVYIAWRQHQTARNKLKLDLYDRRYKVYLGVRDLLAVAVREARFPNDAFNNYWAATHEGRFLFEGDIRDYLVDVRQRIMELQHAHRVMDANQPALEEKRDEAIKKEQEILRWANQEIERLAAIFHKYLGFEKNL